MTMFYACVSMIIGILGSPALANLALVLIMRTVL